MLIVVDELRVLVQEPLPLHTVPVLLGLAEHTAHDTKIQLRSILARYLKNM